MFKKWKVKYIYLGRKVYQEKEKQIVQKCKITEHRNMNQMLKIYRL